MDRFYNDLAPFRDFGAFADMAAYEPVPADWAVFVADIRGSTKAIEAGRYKDVNMVGAACVTAVLNICGDIEVPFVFGGDGATLVLPGALEDRAREVLQGLCRLSADRFGLELRAGMVTVADLRARGADVRVRKFELSPGNYLAMFSGHGMETADALLKDDTPGNSYQFKVPDDTAYPDLTGLSCRWEPLQPQSGRMATLMVRAHADDPAREQQILRDVLAELAGVLGHDTRESAPASPGGMRFRWPPRGLRFERLTYTGSEGRLRHFAGILFQSLVQYWCEKFDRKAGAYDAPAYRKELRNNTDFRKYDDVLRMVLDVSPAQAQALEKYLGEKYRAGLIVYGLHVTDSALMTCLVFSLEQGEHIHFIDGNDGGFAVAAKGFKARMPEKNS